VITTGGVDILERLREVARDRCAAADPAHDFLHVDRVARWARRIAEAEGADVEIAVAAALLHELFNHPKGHPDSHLSGERCAEEARLVLSEHGFGKIEQVCYAIRVHPFSRGIVPDTLEGKVLQDADRLDAIGAIGAARCFATCVSMQRPFYSLVDPLCRTREPDDKEFGTDHFFKKLLRLTFHTETARREAERRMAFLRSFLDQLESEITATTR
jgi:uncharacterized protein